MIINDLSMLGTKMEVWKQYISILPGSVEKKQQLQNELNTLLLEEITPQSLERLMEFIEEREKDAIDFSEIEEVQEVVETISRFSETPEESGESEVCPREGCSRTEPCKREDCENPKHPRNAKES